MRKINFVMVTLSIMAGICGWMLGEFMLSRYGDMPSILLMGVYFGALSLIIALMTLLAEMLTPILNGKSWKREYAATSWKWLVPLGLIPVFLLSCAFQFLYSVNLTTKNAGQDVFMLIDTSGSMDTSDPNSQRLAAAQNLVDTMTKSNRLNIITFSTYANCVQPLTSVTANEKENLKAVIGSIANGGATNLSDALDLVIEQAENRNTIVILISDGYSAVDVDKVLLPFKQRSIPVYTVGMKVDDQRGKQVLMEIAQHTNGNYYNVDEVSQAQISDIFQNIYSLDNSSANLVGPRYGNTSDSMLHTFLRVIFIGMIGCLIALIVAFIFDNRYLLKSFIVGGIVGGLLAGFIFEMGSGVLGDHPLYRLFADISIAAVFTFFSIFARLPDYMEHDDGWSGTSNLRASDRFTKKNSQSGHSKFK